MIQLQHLRPAPIFSKPSVPSSEVWDKELNFKQGRHYLIKAPSGGGKSTLLHIVFGLRKDYEGNAQTDGTDMKTAPAERMAVIRQDQLSIVFQDLRLIPGFTALQNIQVANQIKELKTKEEIQEMAEQLQMADFLHQTADTLSYGQRQRVAIVRALCKPFRFLLLDEPFSHLDPENIRRACALIRTELAARNAGLLLVSHETAYDLPIHEELIL